MYVNHKSYSFNPSSATSGIKVSTEGNHSFGMVVGRAEFREEGFQCEEEFREKIMLIIKIFYKS